MLRVGGEGVRESPEKIVDSRIEGTLPSFLFSLPWEDANCPMLFEHGGKMIRNPYRVPGQRGQRHRPL